MADPAAAKAPRQAQPRQRTDAEVLLANAPWKPAHWDLADATALRALAAGKANPDQQKRAIGYIMRVCGIDDWAYRPGENDRDTNIALGRQYVGHSIVRLLKVDLSKVRRDHDS